MSDSPTPPRHDAAADRAFLGHPRGLGYLGFTEAWERFSYYGMQTLLVLYMTRQLLLPGHVENIVGIGVFGRFLESVYGGGQPMSIVAQASAIFGLYTGLVYLTPIAGGFVADRWLGRTKTVTLGAVLMAAGHFLMAFDYSFLFALLCLLTGVGCFKGNLASQVGDLYAPEDLRRADAFQIYYLFINAAVIIAPLVTGTLGEKVGWHWGFGAAGVGMVLGLIIYLSGRKWLPREERRSTPTQRAKVAGLTRDEFKAIALLIVLLPVLAIGAVGNQEIFNAYLVWVPDHVSLVFFGQTMPTSWLITLDAVVSVSCLVGAVAFWRLWAKRFKEPSEVIKITLGLGISALGAACLAMAAIAHAPGQKAGIGWVLGFELLNSIGFANVFPVGLALYVRAAPKSVAGTIMGIYYLHLFMCNFFVGWLGGLVEKMSGFNFWLLHAGLVGGAGVIMLVAARTSGHLLDPVAADDPAAP
ncbi:MAG TPA: peptide MFS transporter [Lacunisphaera sp.]|nr:peptide MFS transporter [Lacunisphaera sp.]